MVRQYNYHTIIKKFNVHANQVRGHVRANPGGKGESARFAAKKTKLSIWKYYSDASWFVTHKVESVVVFVA